MFISRVKLQMSWKVKKNYSFIHSFRINDNVHENASLIGMCKH